MIAYALNALLFLFLAGSLCWVVGVGWAVIADNHRRGMARVHRGSGWSPRGGRL